MNCQNHKRSGKVVSLALLLVATGCSTSSTPKNTASTPPEIEVSIVEGSEPTQLQKDAMLAAKDALFTQLSGRLMEAMSGNGPAVAISVCQKEAVQIAEAVSAEHGLQIGRTGVRLRNTNNVAPQWAEPLVAAQTETPQFVTLTNGHAAALLPIKLQNQCLMCHGPSEQIAPIIQAQLSKLYPNDQATGFEEGQLRGWFWVDLPNS